MARRKTSKPKINLTIVLTEDESTNLLPPEQAEELRELLQSINQKLKLKKSREVQKRGEHDPNLPPAA